MKKNYRTLKTDAEWMTAALAQSRIEVVERSGELAGIVIDYGGPVQKWTPYIVKIQDTYYMRGSFYFRVKV